jgi:metal-responsive CopG/Arc/MetJ family transcriptional regulator
MVMEKLLISLPDELSQRFKSVVPSKQRSKVLCALIELETKKREKALYECALAVEADEELNADMSHWDITLGDGLDE